MKRGAPDTLGVDEEDSQECFSSAKYTRDDNYVVDEDTVHGYLPSFYNTDLYKNDVLGTITTPKQAGEALFNEANQGHLEMVQTLLQTYNGYLHLFPNGAMCWALQASVNNETQEITQLLLNRCTPYLFREQVRRVYQSFQSKAQDATTDALFQASIQYLSQRP